LLTWWRRVVVREPSHDVAAVLGQLTETLG
jgi:hypothetical protein